MRDEGVPLCEMFSAAELRRLEFIKFLRAREQRARSVAYIDETIPGVPDDCYDKHLVGIPHACRAGATIGVH